MEGSDSDLELLDEIEHVKSKRNGVVNGGSSKWRSKNGSNPKSRGIDSWNGETIRKTLHVDSSGSEAGTDVIGDLENGRGDDLESLLSISPPRSRASPPINDVFECDSDMEMDGNGGGESNPRFGTMERQRMSQGASRKPYGPTSNGFVLDNDAQEIDDFFQEAGYSSLADFIADVRETKTTVPVTGSSLPTKNGSSDWRNSSIETKAKSKSSKKKTSPAKVVESVRPRTQDVNKPAWTKRSKGGESGNKENRDTNADNLRQKKAPRPGEALKIMILQISEDIMSDELAAKLIDKEVQFKITENPLLTNSIFFERNTPYNMIGSDLQVHQNVLTEMEASAIIIFSIEKNLHLLQGELEDSPTESLSRWVKRIQKKHPANQFTILVDGTEAYLRKIQRHVQKEYRDRVLNGDNVNNGKRKKKVNPVLSIQMSRNEIQSAFISAQLQTNITYRFYENTSDLALLLLHYTKAIAEAPYKREKMNSTEFDWYAVSDAVGGIPVEDDGKGMSSLWLAQLTQFPGVGQESALAIARIYKSPKALYKAYRRCNSADEGKELLSNIQVKMGVGPLAKTRRLGPEASKKIYRFFTATDGDRYVS